MFDVVLKEEAVVALRALKLYHARTILDEMDRHLRFQPERASKATIKRLRGKQRATYRLRVGDYRVFYDVGPGTVTVIAILHKSETKGFYLPEESQ